MFQSNYMLSVVIIFIASMGNALIMTALYFCLL